MRVARRAQSDDWAREWELAEIRERLERPHGQRVATALTAAAGGLATAFGVWAGDFGTASQVAAALTLSGLTLFVVPAARQGTHNRVHLLVAAVALLSAGAAAIHFAVIQSHFDEWWGYGAFFVASGIAQLAWSLLVVASPARWVFWLGVAGNAAIVALWILTRTVGTIVGPGASEPEAVGLADVVATAFEIVIVVVALFAARRGLPRWHVLRAASWLVALAVLAFTTIGLLSAVGAAAGVIPATD
jgi:hypothetical protein